MTQKKSRENDELKVYVFYWSNTRMGVTDAKGTTHYFPEKRVVIATTPKEARIMLKNRDKKVQAEMRNQMEGHRPDKEIKKLIRKIFYKDGLCVREFPLKKGLTV